MAYHAGACPAQHCLAVNRASHDPVCRRDSGRSGTVLSGSGHPAAATLMGTDAGRGPNAVVSGTLAGRVSGAGDCPGGARPEPGLSLIHISEPTRLGMIS